MSRGVLLSRYTADRFTAMRQRPNGMEFIRGLYNLRPRHRGTVLTIGNFDGVHLGHRAILQALRDRCPPSLRTCALLFEPTPREFFGGASAAPARLMRLREKLDVLALTGLNQVLCLRFDQRLAQMTPEAFVQQLLVDGLGVRHVLVGEDFRFGRQRAGTLATLREAGARGAFEVSAAPTVTQGGERISSTRIRAALAQHDFARARVLLGRPYAMSGRVIHGAKLGRELGYPTANIPVRRQRTPLHGIFAVRVHGIGAHPRAGVASLGSRRRWKARGCCWRCTCSTSMPASTASAWRWNSSPGYVTRSALTISNR
jgi:riboflavin kinase/FMN adenylyltransferase